MKILFLRHAEPDYEHDSLTEKGDREAKYLSEYLYRYYPGINRFYCSTLGRARRTAQYTLDRFQAKAVYYPWLREFDASIDRPDRKERKSLAWDWHPKDVENHKGIYDLDSMFEDPILKNSDFREKYDSVIQGFDSILNENGYQRKGTYYEVASSNHDTIAIFSHFGVSSVMIAHLMNASPYSLWQNTIALPSSLTEFISEERDEGYALFRMNFFSDYTHLTMNGEKPSFSGRFCECYQDDTRHE